MSEKIKIDLGFAVLVAEPNLDNGYKEICIGLETHGGIWFQDIARVGNMVDDSDVTGNPIQQPNKISAYVYADAHDEDFTDKFVISAFQEPCDMDCHKNDCVFHQKNNRCSLPATLYVDNGVEVTECINHITKVSDVAKESQKFVVKKGKTNG